MFEDLNNMELNNGDYEQSRNSFPEFGGLQPNEFDELTQGDGIGLEEDLQEEVQEEVVELLEQGEVHQALEKGGSPLDEQSREPTIEELKSYHSDLTHDIAMLEDVFARKMDDLVQLVETEKDIISVRDKLQELRTECRELEETKLQLLTTEDLVDVRLDSVDIEGLYDNIKYYKLKEDFDTLSQELKEVEGVLNTKTVELHMTQESIRTSNKVLEGKKDSLAVLLRDTKMLHQIHSKKVTLASINLTLMWVVLNLLPRTRIYDYPYIYLGVNIVLLILGVWGIRDIIKVIKGFERELSHLIHIEDDKDVIQ